MFNDHFSNQEGSGGRQAARPELPDRFFHDEPGDAGARLQQGQDEQDLEHDEEMIEVGHQRFHAGQTGQDLGHPQGQRHGAGRAARKLLFHAGILLQVVELHGLQHPLVFRLCLRDQGRVSLRPGC